MSREIITSERAFSEGMPYPPILSQERIESYKVNLDRFSGEYNREKYIGVKNLKGTVDYFKIMTENYYKLITLKLQGLLLNELPIITYKNNEEVNAKLQDLISSSGFWLAFQQAFRNFSSLGTGALYLYGTQENPKVNSINPMYLYKIVDEYNISDIKSYILAQPITSVDYKKNISKVTHIRVLYHYKGYYIEKVFEYSKGELYKQVSYDFGDYKVPAKGLEVKTGLTDFAVFTFENNPSAVEVYGNSDYTSISDIVGVYEQIMTIVSIVVQKNINPIIQLPYGLMQENEQTGQLEFNGVGSAVEVRKDEKDIKYITYDMQIGDLMGYLDKLIEEIGIQSEMSKTFLKGDFASNISGETVKNLMKSALDKISRSIDQLDMVVKNLFVQMLEYRGLDGLKLSDINIEWQDGIEESKEG